MSQSFYRPTFIRINLQAIQSNIHQLKKKIPKQTQIIAVVKANAYGHGDIEVAKTALSAGATVLAVATPDEALHIREAGITAEILVLGAAPASFLSKASELNITLTAYSLEWLQTIPNVHEPLKVHVKIDSGMGRIGFVDEKELKEALALIHQKNYLQVTGVYTHFSTADEEDKKHFHKQVSNFERMLALFKIKPKMVHTSNSAAALRYPDQSWDAVRYGISMYGIAPSPFMDNCLPFPLERALSLETQVVQVKKVEKGTPIGYGATYKAIEDEWIATLPIGYADGLLRKLQNQSVLVKGKRVQIVGRVCMDQCMIRLEEPVSIGEKVVLIGKQETEEVKIEEWADVLETIPYEVCCMLSNRIPRVYSK
ncbi:alanine racemase [Psychrobacillus sp. FJAT-51614]|uniref:Alanine racemase n=1 Tax=Psychrobacillus mangrovi TaxID=3117745 RepID=A0ABU8F6S8_9BACI